jgi:Zn-dependent M28 family amino/carboxypeptidase
MKKAMLLITTLTVCSLQPVFAEEDNDLLLQERIRAHITFLADDLLRGRQPGTEGHEVAAAYVASQFRQMGLVPAGADGTYFQQVPLRSARLTEGSASLVLVRGEETTSFDFLDDFYIGPGKAHTSSGVVAEMVFAGYGIDAPELEYSDYGDLDASGKVVVTLAGKPDHFPSEEGAHFSSSREKLKAALAAGAIGIITVYTPKTQKRFAWDRVRSRVGMPSMGWLDGQGNVFASPLQLQAYAMIHFNAATVLFDGADQTLDEILALDEAGEPLPVFGLKGKIQVSQESSHETISSPNVVAFLPGSDPLLNDEYITYIAHLDHIGELHGADHQDAINNGALDNASGIAVMLETARLFSEQETPRRSLLFLAVTAEEKGLVGSEYFAHNPTVPVDKLVGAINLDMPLLLYDFGDVIAFGAEHSTLGDAVQTAADEADIALTPDPFPEQNIFIRSDHYRFVQQGIPAIFLVTGPNSRDGETDTQQIFEGFLKEHYHRPSDDLNLPINYQAAARFTRINTRIGQIVANQSKPPSWHEGDFFGDTFKR